jgi:hypothetical protein
MYATLILWPYDDQMWLRGGVIVLLLAAFIGLGIWVSRDPPSSN